MSKVFFDIGLSLDGFIAGENRSPKNPLGDQGTTIHQWMFVQKAFWEHLNAQGGDKDTEDGDLIRQLSIDITNSHHSPLATHITYTVTNLK